MANWEKVREGVGDRETDKWNVFVERTWFMATSSSISWLALVCCWGCAPAAAAAAAAAATAAAAGDGKLRWLFSFDCCCCDSSLGLVGAVCCCSCCWCWLLLYSCWKWEKRNKYERKQKTKTKWVNLPKMNRPSCAHNIIIKWNWRNWKMDKCGFVFWSTKSRTRQI